MADNNHHDDGHAEGGHHVNYFGIYLALLVLFLISVAGPLVGEMTGIGWITLITAFGIALVKANLVIQNFMHLKWEKRLATWLLMASVICVALFMAAVSPDVLNHEGQNWDNLAAKAAVERGIDDGHAAADDHAEEDAPVEEVAGFNAVAAFNATCASCHGQAGDGQGPAGAALNPPAADFTDPAFWATRDSERIFNVIKNGAASVGGSALMVAWGFSYDDEQIQSLVEYVESFRPGQE